MKTNIGRKSGSVKKPAKVPINPRLFGSVTTKMRALYLTQIEALLEQLRSRVEAGEFTDLSDSYTYVRSDSPEAKRLPVAALTGCMKNGALEVHPGVELLYGAVHELLEHVLMDPEYVRAVLCVSAHLWRVPDSDEDSLARAGAECIAHEIRDLYLVRGGARR